MRHLNSETLARLVDETASPEEREHLRSCAECSAELRALRNQRAALSALPDIRPPAGDWRELDARLREEGLIRRRGERRPRPEHRGWTRRRGWLQAAAALVLFLGGTGVGAVADDVVGDRGTDARPAQSVEEAAEALQSAEERYVDAVIRYRELLDPGGDDRDGSGDPASRFAALETLMAASQAAIREAPADPFLNGVLAGTMAERRSALRQISASNEDDWF